MRYVAALALILFGCGKPMPMLNGKPLLQFSQLGDSLFVATGQAEYTNPVCMKNAATRYCLAHYATWATVTMGSPVDGNTAQAFFTCGGTPTDADRANLDQLGC